MATQGDHPDSDPNIEGARRVNRRDFVKTGVAAGIGSGALLGSHDLRAQVTETGAAQTAWDYEADIVSAGGGCAGLTAAIRARDLGADVLVVDQNFDLGGRMLHSAGRMSLGGGDPIQVRDINGEPDQEGLVTVAPLEDAISPLLTSTATSSPKGGAEQGTFVSGFQKRPTGPPHGDART